LRGKEKGKLLKTNFLKTDLLASYAKGGFCMHRLQAKFALDFNCTLCIKTAWYKFKLDFSWNPSNL